MDKIFHTTLFVTKTRYDPEDEEQRHRDLRQQARQKALATQAMSTPGNKNLAEDVSLKEVEVQEDFSGATSTFKPFP